VWREADSLVQERSNPSRTGMAHATPQRPSPGLSREVGDAVLELRSTKEGSHHDDGVDHAENEANVYAGVS